ncbi:hypothetical protein HDV05_007162 [Chytridiales sp. JEL 0842]|nr:hypothetical protein HDV05_007162 [Chytridiales sp. JEL 0842]
MSTFFPLSSYLPPTATTLTSNSSSLTIIEEYQDHCVLDRQGTFFLSTTNRKEKFASRDPIRYTFLNRTKRIPKITRVGDDVRVDSFRWGQQIVRDDQVFSVECPYFSDTLNTNNTTAGCVENLTARLYDSEQTCAARADKGEVRFLKNWLSNRRKTDNRHRVSSLENSVSRFRTTQFVMGLFYSATDGLDRSRGDVTTREAEDRFNDEWKQNGTINAAAQCNSPQSIEKAVVLPFYATCQSLQIISDPAQFKFNDLYHRAVLYEPSDLSGFSVYQVYRISRIPDKLNKELSMVTCIDDKCLVCFPPQTYTSFFGLQNDEKMLGSPFQGLDEGFTNPNSEIKAPPCRPVIDSKVTFTQTFLIDVAGNTSEPMPLPDPTIEGVSILFGWPGWGGILMLIWVGWVASTFTRRKVIVEHENRVANLEIGERRFLYQDESGRRLRSLRDVRIPGEVEEEEREAGIRIGGLRLSWSDDDDESDIRDRNRRRNAGSDGNNNAISDEVELRALSQAVAPPPRDL